MNNMKTVTIIGAGLAGSEAAWQCVKRGVNVRLHEMRPTVMTKAHKTGKFAELVCSNSFRGADLANAVGLLKAELKVMSSLMMEAALVAEVPAGGALAVDREVFSGYIDEKLRAHPLVEIVSGEVSEIPECSNAAPVIVATGPLTSPTLSKAIEKLTGADSLAFFDAISPIMLDESLNHDKLYRLSRYEKGEGDDYLNIPLSREAYYAFIDMVREGEKFGGHEEVESDNINNLRPFEGCMPIEDMLARGPETLRFGPMKPVGLPDPRTGEEPYAVVQLRQDDKAGKIWSMVGFQTRLKHPEQLRIFRTLPGLEEAEFVRLGTVHRNTFIDSPKCLNATLEFRTRAGLFFAGQVTGTEGYVESTAGGIVAGINAARMINGEALLTFPIETAIGSLMNYISDTDRKEFQPMNISFGLMPTYLNGPNRAVSPGGGRGKKIGKKERRLAAAERALEVLKELSATL